MNRRVMKRKLLRSIADVLYAEISNGSEWIEADCETPRDGERAEDIVREIADQLERQAQRGRR